MSDRIPAAQYLRMSTEEQHYSFANQRRAIDLYAEKNGFEVVTSYEDAGKSGVAIASRSGLRRLLQDVIAGAANFRAILVYDVSRWGRFQDADEAAHYEFLCKRSGVPVHYCAEQFVNDGTMPNSIMKALKRSMAGEFSRELGVKVYESKKRLAELGRRMGGAPGFGLRRIAVTPGGDKRKDLAPGERKGFSDDHIALVPGPESDVFWVRQIFSMFLKGKGRMRPTDIARVLNRNCIRNPEDREWSQQSVRRLLTNPKYTGCAVWGRTTQKLGTDRIRLPESRWVSTWDAFKPIISRRDFTKAQEIVEKQKQKRIPVEVLLSDVKRALLRHGRLSRELIEGADDAPCHSTLHRRFGGLKNLYEMVGFKAPKVRFERREHASATEKLRNDLIDRILKLFPNEIAAFRLPNACRRTSLLLDGKFRLYVWACNPFANKSGRTGWYLRTAPRENNGVTLVCTISAGQEGFNGFYLFPAIDVGQVQYSFDEHDEWLRRGEKLASLEQLCEAARAVVVRYAVPIRPCQGPLRQPIVASHKVGDTGRDGGRPANERVSAMLQSGQRIERNARRMRAC